ncbi:PadR family transcriptional regulator [Halospeciosus flavus]|uniref:PadR family transcriptional regulator n=1 Tax=Halospeciosus flavus TaxID=3032283 RepID=A0ABD5Z4F4_9EURY|nr:helix-turn-helix transcriptional regulator [Halospeciosus flavus]
MDELTGFQRDLLFVVCGLDDPNGLDVKAELEDYYQSSINHGRLYPNLDTLVDDGLVEKGRADDRTNRYALTDTGERMVERRRDWQDRYVDG